MDPLETVKKGIEKELVDQKTEQSPVYTNEDEEPVEVKFFFKEIWDKIFEKSKSQQRSSIFYKLVINEETTELCLYK